VKLTSTNRPFGLIIKLSQTVFEREQTVSCLCLHSEVRLRRTCNASQILLSHSRAMSQSIQLDKNVMDPQKHASFKFPVITPRGSHPFPSRTRKLSLAGPMILHGQLCGNVGRRRIKIMERPYRVLDAAFFISGRAPARETAANCRCGCSHLLRLSATIPCGEFVSLTFCSVQLKYNS
jgi:hypothetical protein